MQGGFVDIDCPNVALHCGDNHGVHQHHHRLDHRSWLTLLHDQLTRTLDDGCQALRKQGARGALFKITLSSHGYTVVAKGTVPAFVQDLRHEAEVYRRLQAIQGIYMPICLRAADLVYPYYYDFRVRIVHIIFLSWGGEIFR